MTPTLTTRASYVAALLLGMALGLLYGSARSAADLSALDRDLAVARVRLEHCQEGTEIVQPTGLRGLEIAP